MREAASIQTALPDEWVRRLHVNLGLLLNFGCFSESFLLFRETFCMLRIPFFYHLVIILFLSSRTLVHLFNGKERAAPEGTALLCQALALTRSNLVRRHTRP